MSRSVRNSYNFHLILDNSGASGTFRRRLILLGMEFLMKPMQLYDQFPFWTPPRVRAIKSGVLSFNRDDQNIVSDRLHLIQHMSAWHRAMSQRPWILAHILEALSDDEYAQNCKFHNMQGILFDRAHFCRFFKLHDPIEESSVGGPA